MEDIKQVFLNGVGIYPFTSEEQLISYIDEKKGILVAVNACKIMHDSKFTGDIINNNIGYCDGSGPVIALKQRGYKDVCKIAGCDLWLHLIDRFVDTKTFYIIGGKQEVIEKTEAQLRNDYPNIKLLGCRNGYIKDAEEKENLLNDIATKKPDVVFVAMGSPRQENLMGEMQRRHPNAIYQGLGGSLDVYTGTVKRAPKWWIDHNLEFAYRLLKEPRRLKRDLSVGKMAMWVALGKFKDKSSKKKGSKSKKSKKK